MTRPLLLGLAITVMAAPAMAAPAAPPPPAAAAGPGAADWRIPDPENVLVIDTNKGRILVELVPEVAPSHVQRIKELTREGFYNGLTFFRVIDGFMDQTGDPKNNGTGGSTRPDLAPEFSFRRGSDTPFALAADMTVAELGFIRSMPVVSQSMSLAPLTRDGRVSGRGVFCTGVAGAARGEDVNSANSQFFLMRNTYPALDGRYTSFGRVIAGQEAVLAIKTGEPVADPQDRMEQVRLLADLPERQRPRIRVIDATGAWFKAEVARVRAQKGSAFSACDVSIPAEIK